MTLTITPKVQALLERELESGQFDDPNELIATALLAWPDSALVDPVALDRNIQEGLEQEGIEAADRGELSSEEAARAYLRSIRATL